MSREDDSVIVSKDNRELSVLPENVSFKVPGSFERMSALAGHNLLNTYPVRFIENQKRLPSNFVCDMVPKGPREVFGAAANLRYYGEEALAAMTNIQTCMGDSSSSGSWKKSARRGDKNVG